MIKQIIFDFFGVIADVGVIHERDVRSKHLKVDKEILSPIVEKYWDAINRWVMTIEDFWNNIHDDLNVEINDDPYELFYETMKDVFVYNEVLDLIQELKENGYSCTLLSDVFAPDAEFVKGKGRYDPFDDLILSCDIGLSKLHDVKNGTQEIFEYALEKYSLDPHEAIFIDDTPENCEAANRAGIDTVIATSPKDVVIWVKKLLNM